MLSVMKNRTTKICSHFQLGKKYEYFKVFICCPTRLISLTPTMPHFIFSSSLYISHFYLSFNSSKLLLWVAIQIKNLENLKTEEILRIAYLRTKLENNDKYYSQLNWAALKSC